MASPATPIAIGNWITTYRWIPALGGVAAFALACATGANDLPISFGTSVGSGALSMLQAILIASPFEFTGAVFAANHTADARHFDIWRKTPPDPGLLMWGFFIVLFAATLWLAFATYMELPVSSSLSIQGALLGISLTTKGISSVYWTKHDESSLLKVGGVLSLFLAWTMAPIMAAAISFLFFGSMKLVLLRSQNAEKWVLNTMPFYYGVTVMTIIGLIIFKGAPQTDWSTYPLSKVAVIAVGSGAVAAALAYLIVVPLARKQLLVFENGARISAEISNTFGTFKKSEDHSLKHDQITVEELLRQFAELRVLDTVYEGDEELGDQTPQRSQVSMKGTTPLRKAQLTTSFGQLLARTPNKLVTFQRLQQPIHKPMLTLRQKIAKYFKDLKAKTLLHRIEYDRKTLVRHALAEKFDDRAEELFTFLQILTAIATAFFQGSDDVAVAMSPYASLLQVYKHPKQFSDRNYKDYVPLDKWVLVLSGAGAALGFALWGWKVAKSLGGRLTFLTPSRSFSAQISAIAAILIASQVKLPVSTTHILIGALVGVGAADNFKNVNWRLLVIFVASWFMTVFCSCGLATALFAFTIYSPSYSVG